MSWLRDGVRELRQWRDARERPQRHLWVQGPHPRRVPRASGDRLSAVWLRLAMEHLDALSDTELSALQDAITAERKRRLPQKRKPTLIWDLPS